MRSRGASPKPSACAVGPANAPESSATSSSAWPVRSLATQDILRGLREREVPCSWSLRSSRRRATSDVAARCRPTPRAGRRPRCARPSSEPWPAKKQDCALHGSARAPRGPSPSMRSTSIRSSAPRARRSPWSRKSPRSRPPRPRRAGRAPPLGRGRRRSRPRPACPASARTSKSAAGRRRRASRREGRCPGRGAAVRSRRWRTPAASQDLVSVSPCRLGRGRRTCRARGVRQDLDTGGPRALRELRAR